MGHLESPRLRGLLFEIDLCVTYVSLFSKSGLPPPQACEKKQANVVRSRSVGNENASRSPRKSNGAALAYYA